jgi:hypothetical protein
MNTFSLWSCDTWLCESLTKAKVLSLLCRTATLFSFTSRFCQLLPCFPMSCFATFVQCMLRCSSILRHFSWIFKEYFLPINAFNICTYVQLFKWNMKHTIYFIIGILNTSWTYQTLCILTTGSDIMWCITQTSQYNQTNGESNLSNVPEVYQYHEIQDSFPTFNRVCMAFVPFPAFHCNSVEGKHRATAIHNTHTFVVRFHRGWTLDLNVFCELYHFTGWVWQSIHSMQHLLSNHEDTITPSLDLYQMTLFPLFWAHFHSSRGHLHVCLNEVCMWHDTLAFSAQVEALGEQNNYRNRGEYLWEGC